MMVQTVVDATTELCLDLRRGRRAGVDMLRARFDRAVAGGELPAGFDVETVARFYVTVQQGMSVSARDGAGRDALLGTVRCAMAAWDGLANRAS
jgi:hypothetical protein